MLGEQKSNFYTVKDIAPADFINAFAQYLKKNNLIERPKWADLVKTSTGNFLIYSANELAPLDDDWIYHRVAALARKVYIRPRTGVNLLSHIYGKKYRVASRHPRHEHASLKIIRWGLQQLEKQKIIKKDKKGDALKINSRVISE
jgi:small subunit ribosomal protein S19e